MYYYCKHFRLMSNVNSNKLSLSVCLHIAVIETFLYYLVFAKCGWAEKKQEDRILFIKNNNY